MTRFTLLLATLVLAACSDSPAGGSGGNGGKGGPPTGTPGVVLDRTTLTLTALGEVGALTATVGAQNTNQPTLTLEAESRRLSERPVLDAAALAQGRIVAFGPGEATLKVAAFNGTPAALQVSVRPTKPFVATGGRAAGDSVGTVTLRGWGLASLPAAAYTTSDGASGTVLSADSGNARIRFPAASTLGGCYGSAPTGTLQVAGADLLAAVSVRRSREGEVSMARGQVAYLGAPQDACVRFAAGDSASYAIVYVDSRPIARAETQHEGGAPQHPQFVVAVADRTTAGSASLAPAASSVRASRTPIHSATTSARSVSANAFHQRATPYALGETFTGPAGDPLRVERIYAGYVVVAVALNDTARVPAWRRWLASMDSVAPDYFTHGEPLLRGAFLNSRPLSSTGSGQFLVIGTLGTFGGVASVATSLVAQGGESVARSYMAFNPNHIGTEVVSGTFAHEMTHAYQADYGASIGVASAGSASSWGMEAGADLVEAEVGRLRGSFGLDGNVSIFAFDRNRLGAAWLDATVMRTQNSEAYKGYGIGADMLRRFAATQRGAGVTHAAAMQAVLRGAVEGWNGFGTAGRYAAGSGLKPRMQRALGGAWDPARASLDWMLSRVLDDRGVGAASLNDPAFLRVWGHTYEGRSTSGGWKESGIVSVGSAASTSVAGSVAGITSTASGGTLTVTHAHYQPGFIYVRDSGVGSSVRIQVSHPGIQVALVRL
jgi:hypothetical protein